MYHSILHKSLLQIVGKTFVLVERGIARRGEAKQMFTFESVEGGWLY